MPDLTFGEQVKIVLGRKGMTIKELAGMIEQRTDKKMSRQNLTQRLGRDNFQEQDMRMIASILECPFRLSILGEDTLDEKDREAAEGKIDDIEEEAAGKEKIQEEEDVLEEQETALGTEEMLSETEEEIKEESSGREITVGEFLEIRKSSGESAQEQLMQELLAEMDSIEREDRERSIAWEERKKEQQDMEKRNEKKGGWMSRFRFRRHEEPAKPDGAGKEAKATDDVQAEEESLAVYSGDEAGELSETGMEDAAEADSEEFTENDTGRAPGVSEPVTFSDRIKEYTLQDDGLREQLYEDEEEDLEAGDVNPYTGREYASNSVRMHPKRIGYVQVYNRKDHRWTDMTEWAFLGYQERKKVLLGKDYEPPIYLD